MKKGLMTAIVISLFGFFGGASAQLIPAWTEIAASAAPIVIGGSEAVTTKRVTTSHTSGQGTADGMAVMQDTLSQVTALAVTLGQRCMATTMKGGNASLLEMVDQLSSGALEVPAGTSDDLRVFKSGNTLRFTRAFGHGTISGECTLK